MSTGWQILIKLDFIYRIHRIFLDFFHRPVFQKTQRFGNWICFRLQVNVGEKRLALSKGPNWVGVFSPTFTWGRKQIQFPKHHVFLEYRMMEKAQKNFVNSVQHAPSSESFQVYLDFIWSFWRASTSLHMVSRQGTNVSDLYSWGSRIESRWGYGKH
jgi:hypothetical protein